MFYFFSRVEDVCLGHSGEAMAAITCVCDVSDLFKLYYNACMFYCNSLCGYWN